MLEATILFSCNVLAKDFLMGNDEVVVKVKNHLVSIERNRVKQVYVDIVFSSC